MPSITVLQVNLALTCVESVLYGIFFVLAITSLVVLVARRCLNPNGTSSLYLGRTLLSSPLAIGTLLLFIAVGGVSGSLVVVSSDTRSYAWSHAALVHYRITLIPICAFRKGPAYGRLLPHGGASASGRRHRIRSRVSDSWRYHLGAWFYRHHADPYLT